MPELQSRSMKGKQELMASQGKEGYMLMNFHEQRVARRIINAHINAWPRFLSSQ